MAPGPATLFGLLGDPTVGWPSEVVHQHTGHVAAGDHPDPTTWLAALDASVLVSDVRTGATTDRVAVAASLSVDPALGFASFPGGWPFVIASMPDVEFRILPFADPARSVGMFVSNGDDGAELLLEGLPVEIRLPTGLVAPHPDLAGDAVGGLTVEVGEFQAGRLDDLKVIYRRTEPTSILVHVRLHVDRDLAIDVQPAVPISFGPCALSDIACRAVHDFRLIPSPSTALDHHEWLRHGVEPWLPGHTAAYDGLFSVRTVDVDETAEGLQDVVAFLNSHSRDAHPTAELVLDGLVVPFHGPFWLPVPRHATLGIRRNVLDVGAKEEVYAFDRAPVHLHLSDDPRLAFDVESLFYRSQPATEADEDLGLTFEVALVFGEETSPNNALAITLGDDYLLGVGYRRDFGADGSLLPGETPEREVNELLHVEVAGFVIADIMAFDVGFSLGRKFGQDKSVSESLVATFDAFVSMPPTGGSDTAGFRLRGLDGQKVAFPIEGIGWRYGLHVEGLSLPDGVVAYMGPLALVISELGLVAEQGASYLSFSGGLLSKLPAGTKGGLTVRRLRGRLAGDESQPKWKIDGLFLLLEGGGFRLEGGGYYSETDDGTTAITEYAFTALVAFHIGSGEHRIGMDLLRGEVTTTTDRFGYFLFQAFYEGQIGPFGGIELRSARFLFADDMVPKLKPVEGDSRQLRYYTWHVENDPLKVAGDRRLAAWKASPDSWALGIGASASFVALGRLVELDLFVLGVSGPQERGLLVAARLFVMRNRDPIGFLAIELDRASGRASAVLGVDATLDKFADIPDWMAPAGGFTGTLFLSNEPDTLAIGRLADQKTWLALRFDVDVFVEASLVIGFCLELVEDGPKGFGLVVSLDGLIGRKGKIALTFHAGWGMTVEVFSTGSTDYSASIYVEAAIRFVLFGFLRIGVSARLEFRTVGTRPARSELTGEVRLETPWWLPDLTWRLDCQLGELAPAELSTAASPLRSASAVEPGTVRRLHVHVERFDPSWDGVGVSPTASVAELRAPTRSEATRLAAVAADPELRPVATDATITVEWSVPVNDRLGLTNGVAAAGDQVSGDLTLSYDLVGIAVRRRPRFGPDRAWKPLDERIEIGPDFSDPGGVQLDGEFAPQVLSKAWDLDVRAEGGPVPKKLLVNGVAPFDLTTADLEADERLVRRFPSWPCCAPPDDRDLEHLFHRVTWRDVGLGAELGIPRTWTFTDSASTLRFPRPAWAHPAGFAGLPAGTVVAGTEMVQPGVVARADLVEDASVCVVRAAWPRGVTSTVVALDDAGREVGRRELGSGTGAFVTSVLWGQGPIRRIELRAARPAVLAAAATNPGGVGMVVELDEVAYVSLSEHLDLLAGQSACEGGGGGGRYEGRGKLGLLPNHEYELRFTTRVTIAHPSVPAESADVEEYVYLHTKGLPGLNAVDRVGEELDRYVRGAYSGGRSGFVYREEPVTLAFGEGFHVAVPLTSRPPGSAEEHTTLLRMQLLVTPDVALTTGTALTATADDWVVANRGAGVPPRRDDLVWFPVATKGHTGAAPMTTIEPVRHRLAGLTQRPGVPCGSGDPRRVIGTVLVAPPQGEAADPDDPDGPELWAARTRMSAAVRAQGAGFVDRRPFAEGDHTAFSRSGGSWSVIDGELRVDSTSREVAVFGEVDWDHLTVVVGIGPGSSSAGVGFAVTSASAATGGLFATVEGPRLVVRRRSETGAALVEVGSAPLPATGAPSSLEVTAFDDRLRASVGEAVVEVDRGDLRSGRLCLVADGPASFPTLTVHGLDMYRFPVAVSRYRSFAEHVDSWDGHLADLVPDALGAGTTTSDVAGLWAMTAADIAAVMAPDAPPEERQRIFGRWVDGLALGLSGEVEELRISRWVDGARTHLLLIESPEPLDFTEEIAVGVTRRQVVGPFPPVRPDGDGPLDTLSARLESVARGRVDPIAPRPLPGVDETIIDVEVVRDGLRLTLHPALSGAGVLSVVAVGDDGARLYRGRVRAGPASRSPANLPVVLVGPVPRLPRGSEVGAAIRGARDGTILLATDDLATLLGRFALVSAEVDVDVPVTVVQSGDGRRALVVRTGGAPFVTGLHRLRLALTRRRWDTTEPLDSLNAYRGERTVSLDL